MVFRCRFGSSAGFEYVSPSSLSVTGYGPEEFYAEPNLLGRIVHQDYAAALLSAMNGESFGSVRISLRAKDGRSIAVDLTVEAERSSSGELLAADGMIRWVQGDDELSQLSRKFFEDIFRSSPDLVVIIDMDGVIKYISPHALDAGGFFDLSDIVGRSVFDFVAEEERSWAHEDVKTLIDTDQLKRRIYTLLRKDGSTFIGEISASLFRDRKGRPEGVVAFMRDVTSKLSAEQTLLRDEKLFRTLSSNAPIGIALLNRNQAFEYVNPAFVKIFGYDLTDLTVKGRWLELAFPDSDYRQQMIMLWKEHFIDHPSAGAVKAATLRVA
jgi:PAS domain S-box-containing protein